MSGAWSMPAVIAHRCGGALAPENSLAGLRIAAALGVRAVEFDVQLSADGHPVVIHDDTLVRTAGRPGDVTAMQASELASCDIGRTHHAAFAGESLPDLAAVAAECIRLGLAANVELKCDDSLGERTGRAVAGACEALWRDAPVKPLLSSFSEVALDAAAAAAPGLARAWLVEHVPGHWQRTMRALRCVSLHCSEAALDRSLPATVHRAGYRLAAYTANDPRRARDWFELGVDALFTDRPDLLLAIGFEATVLPP